VIKSTLEIANAVEIVGLKKVYKGGVTAVNGIDLKIENGDFFALLGANGAGKTTTLGILAGLVNKTEGNVKVFGHDIDEEADLAKMSIGLVPQEFNFSIWETVWDIVVVQGGYFGVKRAEAASRAEKILKDLSLWDKKDVHARALSGGMKRRLMIARALIHQPKLLILDEPTAGVDVELRKGMWDYLVELNKAGTTILLTTHYLEEVEALCRNVAIIKKGEIVKQDSVKNMLKSLEKQTYVVTVDKLSTKFIEGKSDQKFKLVDDNILEVEISLNENLTEVVNALDFEGAKVIDIKPKGNRIEQLLLNILNK